MYYVVIFMQFIVNMDSQVCIRYKFILIFNDDLYYSINILNITSFNYVYYKNN